MIFEAKQKQKKNLFLIVLDMESPSQWSKPFATPLMSTN